MRQDTTLFNSATLGNSQAANTLVTLINAPGPGRYKIWGIGRHNVADGFKLTSPVTVIIPSGPNDTVIFGPLVVDITNFTSGINIALNVATGASDTATFAIFAERINQ